MTLFIYLLATGLNDCSANPCENGASCSDTATGMKCKCAKGFEGRFCESTYTAVACGSKIYITYHIPRQHENVTKIFEVSLFTGFDRPAFI